MHGNDELGHIQSASLFSIGQIPYVSKNIARQARFLERISSNVSCSEKLDAFYRGPV
jgi:hypothetical protein